MLREGYNGTYEPLLREVVRRAAWSHMLMQSPWGEIPTGGRSSQHQWNEAVSALAYEIFATQSAAAGDAQAACMFQRAAHLSHASVRRWQNPTGELQIVKNHFNASLRWGYEGYSYQSQYNLLPASMLSAAFMYADHADAIPECAGFADVGGFAYELPEHHLIIANAGGVYVEVETAADPHYDSTGVNRVHINTCGAGATGACVATHPFVTSTAGPPQENGGIAFGPWWATHASAPGARRSLGNATYADVDGVAFTPAWGADASAVAFSLEYFLVAEGVLVTQTFSLAATPLTGAAPSVTVDSQVELLGSDALRALAAARGVRVSRSSTAGGVGGGNLTRMGLQWPAFGYDGVSNTTTSIDAGASSVTVAGPPAWGSATWALSPASGRAPTLTPGNASTVTRNGIMDVVWVETEFSTAAPSLRASLTVTGGTAPPV